MGCDLSWLLFLSLLLWFLLTHPVWDVTMRWIQRYSRCLQFLLTHPVWDVTIDSRKEVIPLEISTHTSRVGCDVRRSRNFYGVSHFYSHIPCGMWRKSAESTTAQSWFLLTHPVWDVTKAKAEEMGRTTISTHTSRVGCDALVEYAYSCRFISTHTSRVGCDKKFKII